jgi:hypothetical protein
MRYRPRSVAALQIALGGFPDEMGVEIDENIGVSAKTVGELRNGMAGERGDHNSRRTRS